MTAYVNEDNGTGIIRTPCGCYTQNMIWIRQTVEEYRYWIAKER